MKIWTPIILKPRKKMMNYKSQYIMRKVVSLLFLFITLAVSAQEPANNLRKSIPELKQKFPDLIRWGGYDSEPNYKSPKANTLFTIKNNQVAIEFTMIVGENDYLHDLFSTLVERFRRGSNKVLWSNDKKSISIFYSYFYVSISYTPYSDVTIKYQLNSY